MQSSNAHTLGSQSLTQISTKLERERKGKRWIFNLSSTPTKGTQSLLKIWHIAMGKREERNPSSQRATMGNESSEEEEGEKPALSTHA
jgi:hypothetical protein